MCDFILSNYLLFLPIDKYAPYDIEFFIIVLVEIYRFDFEGTKCEKSKIHFPNSLTYRAHAYIYLVKNSITVA